MSLSSRSVKTTSVKRVSFEDTVSETFMESNKDKKHAVEISEMFPNINAPSILKTSKFSRLNTLTPMSEEAKQFLNKRKKRQAQTKCSEQKELKKVTSNREYLPNKEPTESLAHALLRAMTHQIPSKRSKAILPKITLIPDAGHNRRVHSPGSRSTRTSRSLQSLKSSSYLGSRDSDTQTSFINNPRIPLPEIMTSSIETNVIKIDRACGICRRNWRLNRRPAAGYCKFCDEYLCGDCVINHRKMLTKLHPVIVFYCDICKEMNILNKAGAGYCIKCKHFYCPVCVLLHCGNTNHEVLEGNDLLDVTDVMIGKKSYTNK
ncbi:hypothetical protein ACF0H5_021267 [Mactra antiquata]